MKLLTTTVIATMMAPMAFAGETVNARVKDHYATVYEHIPVTKRYCENVEVPVYGTRQKQGNAAEGAILGMIIGGLAGKAVTGKDNGAAAGAIMGGVIGADKGAKPKNETVVTGYRTERQCTDVTEYVNNPKNVYDYSTLVFTLDGKQYRIDFNK